MRRWEPDDRIGLESDGVQGWLCDAWFPLNALPRTTATELIAAVGGACELGVETEQASRRRVGRRVGIDMSCATPFVAM